jgi:hypothetical protein
MQFDGCAEFWAYDVEVLRSLTADPFYIETIRPDEANFIDASTVKITLGVDYFIVDNNNLVEEHGRKF